MTIYVDLTGLNMNENTIDPVGEEPSPAKARKSRAGRSSLTLARINPWLVIALLALGLAGWQWFETRTRLAKTQAEMTRRLSENEVAIKENQRISLQAQEKVEALNTRVDELRNQLAESKSQHAVLETLYQNLASNRDEWSLAEIEQSVMIAAQQLQLSRNVQGAVFALQTAEARLADSSRPQFIGLRKILARDLEKLQKLPQIDVPGMSMRVESILVAIDTLPLKVDAPARTVNTAPPEAAETATDSKNVWKHLATDFWREMRNLVRIQRFDREDTALLAPGQAFFLRENLKLRLLHARLALLSNDEHTFRNELKQAQAWITQYFDGQDKSVQSTLTTLKMLLSSPVSVEMPNLNDTLSAIKTFNLGKGNK